MTSNSSQKDRQDAADSESEEEDYMSDAFLQKLEKRDVKPGLKHVRQPFFIHEKLTGFLQILSVPSMLGHFLILTKLLHWIRIR